MQPQTVRPAAKGGLFLAAFCFFLVTGGREAPWGDARPIWEVADALVRRGAISIATPWPPDLPRGRNNRVYAVAPLLQSLVHVPGAAGRRALGQLAPRSAPHSLALASHVGPAALGALVCVLFFGLCSRLGFSKWSAGASTALLAAATTLWVYARSPYGEILQAACFTAFFAALVRAPTGPPRRAGLVLGATAGLLVASKLVYAVAVLGGVVFLAGSLRGRWRELRTLVLWAAAAAAPFAALVLFYNWARWGSLTDAGYVLTPKAGVVNASPFGEKISTGLWGMFLSPGKSVFLYSPPLVLALFGFPRLLRRSPAVVWAMTATIVPVLLVYSRFLFWAGDYAWGPRYLVFAVPVMLLPAAALIDDVRAWAAGWRRRVAAAAIGAVAAIGLFVQALGISFYWDHFIRISHEAATRWLGAPDRRGAPTPERDGLCGACFEDMYPLQWLPAFQPIHGHWWLLKHVVRGDDWTRATTDAPWRRYTSLELDVSARYREARLDWWFLGLREVNAGVAWGGLIVLVLGVMGGGAVIVTAGRRRPEP